MSVRPLFHDRGDLSPQLRGQEQRALDAVKNIAPNIVLTTPEADLVDQLYDEHKVDPLELHIERKYSPTGVASTKIDVRGGGYRDFYDGYGPTHVDGTRYELAIPFDGEAVLFDLQPSNRSTMFPRAEIRGRDVVLVYEGMNPANAEAIKAQLEQQLLLLRGYVEWSAQECRAYNERLRPGLVAAVRQWREKLLHDRQVEASLDYPVKRRGDPDPTLDIAVPRRRREVPVVSRAPAKGFAPEPAIKPEVFADIVSVIRSLGLAAERFPDTFGKMPEPVLREILLVVLNNQFGPSGGELFSRSGKTDVAILSDNGAVFIAECKFWSGEKGFDEAIDQLLGYLVWRDTKSALVLFVRQKNVSDIQEKAQQRLREHGRFKRQVEDVASCPVFILHHRAIATRRSTLL